MPPLSEAVRTHVHHAHALQLSQLQEPALEDIPDEEPPLELKGMIEDWIDSNPKAISAAKSARCSSSSPSSPNWDVVLYTLVESSAMYLRKPALIKKAIAAAKATPEDLSTAVRYIKEAQEDIDSIAKKLDCTFIQLCDFSKQAPDGTWFHTGAFCGLFISNSQSNVFMGVAFKGSNHLGDYITDADWKPIQPLLPDVAWGAEIHRGFYLGLFGNFKDKKTTVTPFDILTKGLAQSYHDNALLHFTGHSLGGAYCTLTYGEFLRLQGTSSFQKFQFGDMYSLAAPRVCLEPFAMKVNSLTPDSGRKYLFRIVNKGDPVPTIPPPLESDVVDYPFIHVGGAWKINDQGPAEKMNDEPPPVPPSLIEWDIVWKVPQHYTTAYYSSWQKTKHS